MAILVSTCTVGSIQICYTISASSMEYLKNVSELTRKSSNQNLGSRCSNEILDGLERRRHNYTK